MHDDSLHGDATLPGLIERTEHDALHGIFEVRILVDDHCGIAAQLEHDFFFAGPRLEIPTHVGRASEGQQLQPLVGGEQIRAIARARQNGKCAFRQWSFREHLADDQRA